MDLIEAFDRQVAIFERDVRRELAGHAGYQAIQEIPGVGETFAAIFVAEIGDVRRFTSPHHLCSWAGLTPKHRESDTTVHRGPITKQGSRLVRWAAIEAAQRQAAGTKLRADFVCNGSPTIRWPSQWCSSSSASKRPASPGPIGATLSPAKHASRTHHT